MCVVLPSGDKRPSLDVSKSDRRLVNLGAQISTWLPTYLLSLLSERLYARIEREADKARGR